VPKHSKVGSRVPTPTVHHCRRGSGLCQNTERLNRVYLHSQCTTVQEEGLVWHSWLKSVKLMKPVCLQNTKMVFGMEWIGIVYCLCVNEKLASLCRRRRAKNNCLCRSSDTQMRDLVCMHIASVVSASAKWQQWCLHGRWGREFSRGIGADVA